MTTPLYTANDIADWFLAKAESENMLLKPMKLQKLVYFAYGWYYAFRDQPLFSETIYAFRHGPVVKDLYDRFREFRGDPITCSVPAQNLDETVNDVLEVVWKSYGSFNDIQLRNVTHLHAPWIDAYRSDEWYAVMPPNTIKDFFQKMLEEQSHANA